MKQLSYVDGVQYIPKEQAYDAERARDPSLIQFLEEFHLANPFPDTIAVTLRSLADYDRFAAFSRQSQWKTIVDPTFLSQATDQEAQVHEMLRVTQAGQTLVFVFLALIAGILLFVLMELTRRRAQARSEEMLIERLMGADTPTILVPFVVEATMLLIIALALALLIVSLFLVFVLPIVVPALGADGVFHALRTETVSLLWGLLPGVLLFEILLTPVLAFVAAWLALRSQLQTSCLSLVTN